MSTRPLSDQEFKDIYSRVPRLCVDPVIRSAQGIILSLRTLPSYHNQWHTPGGTVLYRESVVDAAHRKAREELGIDIRILGTLGYIEYPSEVAERGYGYTVSINLLAETDATTLTLDHQASEARFFTSLPDHTIAEQREFLTAHWDTIKKGAF